MTIADPEMTISRSAISLMMVTAILYGVGLIVHRRSRIVPQRSLLPSTTAVWIETTVVVVIVVRHL